MSLYALPVSVSDLTQLQQGIQFSTDAGQASAQMQSINNNQGTVFSYAQTLLANNVALSQVAMADFAYAIGKTDTVAHLTAISTQFLGGPNGQLAFINAHPEIQGGPIVFDAQVYALALAGGNRDFAVSLANQVTAGTFAQNTADLTGTGVAGIQQFFTNWQKFYTANPNAAPGLSADVAAAASAWGDAMGIALGRAKSDTGPGSDKALAIQSAVANALFDIAQTASSPPGQKYVEGVAIGNLPTHTKFQGEGGGGTGQTSEDSIQLIGVQGELHIELSAHIP